MCVKNMYFISISKSVAIDFLTSTAKYLTTTFRTLTRERTKNDTCRTLTRGRPDTCRTPTIQRSVSSFTSMFV